MAEGKRPGGLTALAVLNFVFGGIVALWGLLLLAANAFVSSAESAAKAKGANIKGADQAVVDDAKTILLVGGLTAVLAAVFMITSGVGFLKMKKFLGRTLGNVGAITLAASAIVIAILGKQGVGLGTIIWCVYPLITIALINTTFKEDLTN